MTPSVCVSGEALLARDAWVLPAVHEVCWPVGARVRRTLVREGQLVRRGDPLLELEPATAGLRKAAQPGGGVKSPALWRAALTRVAWSLGPGWPPKGPGRPGAPTDGVVHRLLVTSGGRLEPGCPFLMLAQVEDVFAVALFPEAARSVLAATPAVSIQLAGGSAWPGALLAVLRPGEGRWSGPPTEGVLAVFRVPGVHPELARPGAPVLVTTCPRGPGLQEVLLPELGQLPD